MPPTNSRRFFENLYHWFDAQGLATLSHESGPAQMEVNFRHGDALRLTDQLIVFKPTLHEAALNHGISATFMAKPIAQWVFPEQAAGSLVERDGKVVGSALIGQAFSDPGHFWGRPSATSPIPYNASASSDSNLGPLNPVLAQAIKDRVETLRAATRAVGKGSRRPGL